MPAIKISLPHQLPPAEAQARIQKLLAQLQTQHGGSLTDLCETWTASRAEISFRYMSFAINGHIEVLPGTIDLEIKFPLAGLPFKSRIEAEIKETASQVLSS